MSSRLTTARLLDARSGRRIPAAVAVLGARLTLRPESALPSAPYRVRWHTVSALDGHALEGSFAFGVRTRALGEGQSLEQSPLARSGWLRIVLRTGLYATLLFFGGGLLGAVLLSRGRRPWEWLLPAGVLTGRGDPADAGRRIWARTRTAGWLAAVAALGVALAETADAAGDLSPHNLDAYLLSTLSGAARGLVVIAIVTAAALATRAARTAVLALAAALLAIALAGHADSASPRALAVGTDWLHLVAATAWVGGIGQIVVTWLPAVRALSSDQRRLVMSGVLAPFGRVAFPAFALTVAAGVGNAVIELGRPSELVTSAYGRVLAVKILAAGAIAVASYLHARRLRPRLLARAPRGLEPAERRHWGLLGGEPVLGVAVVALAALLAAFPLPPRQLLERAEAGGARASSTAAATATLTPPGGGQLAVAEEAGPWIAAAWVRRDAAGVDATLRLYDYNTRPVSATIRITGAHERSCGRGCVVFAGLAVSPILPVTAVQGNRSYRADIPVRWDPNANSTAERILRQAAASEQRLRTFRIAERLSGGLGGGAQISTYRVAGRHRYAVVVGAQPPNELIAIGPNSWFREDHQPWQHTTQPPLDALTLMPWWVHRSSVRLLDRRRERGRPVADIALADLPGARPRPPFWFRLHIDLRTGRVLHMRMIAPGHFMDQTYSAFNAPASVRPPTLG